MRVCYKTLEKISKKKIQVNVRLTYEGFAKYFFLCFWHTEKLFLILLQTANLLQAIISYSVLVFCPSVSVKWLTLSKKWTQ